MVKRLPAMRETRVQSLGQEDPLEKEMATHSSTFAWKILCDLPNSSFNHYNDPMMYITVKQSQMKTGW